MPVEPGTGRPAHAAMVHRPFSFPTHDWPGPTVLELPTQGNVSRRRLGWDEATSLPFLDYLDSEATWHQLWYENEQSICAKQQLVSRMQLGGMGLFLADFLSGQTNQTASIWSALARAVGDSKSVCSGT